MDSVLNRAVEKLEGILAGLGSVVVGFSGGIDSTYLAVMANKTLGGEKMLAITADSPSLPRDELLECEELASELGLALRVVTTDEFSNPNYLQNDELRCFYCKSELMDALAPIAAMTGAVVVLGVNASDEGDYRPGQKAAASKGARFPLKDAGMTKTMIREHSRMLGISNSEKPQAACLASRVPYGTPITLSILSRVERAERFLRSLGLEQVRVRDYQAIARIEVGKDEIARCASHAVEIDAAIKQLGYSYATLDLGGFVSGNLNRDLDAATVL